VAVVPQNNATRSEIKAEKTASGTNDALKNDESLEPVAVALEAAAIPSVPSTGKPDT
jgi:hypothetical protein